jgi:ABC-type dipeptide/oligopeptide/nickel transport system permease component
LNNTRTLLKIFTKRLLTSLLILVSIIILTQAGLYLADQGRRGLPVTLMGSLSETAQHSLNYVLQHPSTYLWHKAVTPWYSVLLELFTNSAGLLGLSLVIAAVFGVLIGILAALLRRKNASPVMVLISILGISTPSFLLGMLLWVANINYFKLTGAPPLPPTGFGWDAHLVMPALVLAMRPFAQIMQVTYIAMSEALAQEYIRAAQARGATPRRVIFQHALRNIWIPILTTLSTSLRFSLSSLPVVETFFLWPGIGLTLLQAITANNLPLVTDLVVSLGLLFLVLNLFLDVVYPLLDPRLQRDSQQTEEEEEGGSSLREWLEDFVAVFKPRRKTAEPSSVQVKPIPAELREQVAPFVTTRWDILRSALTNPSLVAGTLVVGLLLVLAIWGPNLVKVSPYETNGVMMIAGKIQAPPFAPSETFPWGSDLIGRDVQAMVLSGGRQTLTLVALAMMARVLLGVLLGMLAGWRQNSWFDRLVQALTAIWAAFPATIFATILILAIGIQKGMGVFVVALCVVGWSETAQYVRSQVIAQKPLLYIEAARSAGARSIEILKRHILPHLLPSIIVLAVMEMGGILMLLAELGYLNIFLGGGFKVEIGETAGMVPMVYYYSDVPEWGAQLANIRNWWRSYPWLAWYPGLCFFLAVLGFNLWGEGLRRFLQESKINLNRFINRYSLGALVVLLAAAGIALRGSTPIETYYSQALQFDEARAVQHIQALTSPDLHGREGGTEDVRLAAEYIAEQMKAAGLQSSTADGNYIFPKGTTSLHIAAPPILQIEDGQTAPLYQQDYKAYISNEVRIGENSGQVVGVAISPAARSTDLPKIKLRSNEFVDKVVLIRQADLPWVQVNTKTGLLVVSEEASLSQKRQLYPMSTAYEYSQDGPAILITPALAERLLAGCGSSLEALSQQAQKADVGNYIQTTPGAQVHLNVPVNEGDVEEKQYSVIGVLPGSGAKQILPNGRGMDSQLIVVSAYFDGLGSEAGKVYPGANDNASGVAEMLELARTLKQGSYEPKKTVIFVAWSPGERGVGFGVNDLLNETGHLGMLSQEVIVELSGVGAGSGQGIALDSGTSFRLEGLITQIGNRLGVPVTNRGRGPHFGFATRGSFSGRSALSVYMSWDGSDQTSHTYLDTVRNIDPEKLRKSGQLSTLLVTLISRESEY